MTQELERKKDVVRAMLRALEQHDFDALEQHPGLHETRRYHPLWQKAFKNLAYDVNQMIVDGDTVASRLTMHGTHVGPFMGVEPTGIEFHIGALMMDRVVEDKIVEHWANADWVSVLGRLGVIPPPPET